MRFFFFSFASTPRVYYIFIRLGHKSSVYLFFSPPPPTAVVVVKLIRRRTAGRDGRRKSFPKIYSIYLAAACAIFRHRYIVCPPYATIRGDDEEHDGATVRQTVVAGGGAREADVEIGLGVMSSCIEKKDKKKKKQKNYTTQWV